MLTNIQTLFLYFLQKQFGEKTIRNGQRERVDFFHLRRENTGMLLLEGELNIYGSVEHFQLDLITKKKNSIRF